MKLNGCIISRSVLLFLSSQASVFYHVYLTDNFSSNRNIINSIHMAMHGLKACHMAILWLTDVSNMLCVPLDNA